MNASRQFRIYDEKFGFPLQTAHGVWERRRSLILREEKDDGVVRYGEVAPTPGFADCSLEDLLPEARAWIRGRAYTTDRFFFPLSLVFRVKFGFLSMVLKGSPFFGPD